MASIGIWRFSRPRVVGRALLPSGSHFQDSLRFPSLYQPLLSHLPCSPLSRHVLFSPWEQAGLFPCILVSLWAILKIFWIVFFHVESNLMWSLCVNMCEALLMSVEVIDSFQSNKTAEQKQVASVLQSRSCDLNTSLGQLVNSSSPVTPVLLAKLSAGYIWK